MGIQCSLKILDKHDIAILCITGDLDFDEHRIFVKALTDLLKTPVSKLVIDMSRITRMSSVFIGELVAHGQVAGDNSKSLSVSVPGPVAKICQDSGLDKVVNLIIA